MIGLQREITADRWRENRLAVSGENAVPAHLGRSRARNRKLERELAELPPGTEVVLCASAPGALRRLRRFASRVAIELDGEYLAFPSASAPAYIVEDQPAPLGTFLRTVLVEPPGTVLTSPIGTVLAVLRTPGGWWVTRRLAPGRLAVGRRA